MKKIVLSIFTLQGGGAERFVLTLAETFRDMGHDIHVVCFKKQNDYSLPDGIQYHYLNYQSFRILPKGIFRYKIFANVFDRYIRNHIGFPDLILSNLHQVDFVLHYSKLKNIVYVLHNTISVEYDLDANPKLISELKQLYSNKPAVGVSHGVVTDYQHHISEHSNMRFIHNPIPQTRIIEQSTQYTPTLPTRYIVHVGKFKAQKDHKTLIRAFAESPQDYFLVLVGTGPLKYEIEQLVNNLGVSDKVIFAGFQENPYPFIANADAMILSSQFEGFGIVIAEALALGVPVISTDCESGPRELLPENNLVPVGDVKALADKIADLFSDPDKYQSDFDINLLPEVVAEKYLSVVE